MQALYAARRSCYQLAQYRVDTSATPIDAIVEQVLDQLN
jgi:hypothetical protein